MGIESLQKRPTYGLEELGLLDTAPAKAIDTVVSLCAETVKAPVVAFLVFDDNSASLLIRSITGHPHVRNGPMGPSEASVARLVREESGPVAIANLADRPETSTAVECGKLNAVAAMGAPVLGPGGEIIGVLEALTHCEQTWSDEERRLVSTCAYLLSEQIMFRAALETVKLMARERMALGSLVPRRN